MKKVIYYWGPFLDRVGTIRAIKNSADSVSAYSKTFETKIINAVGEWNFILSNNNDSGTVNLNCNFYKKLPRYSYLKSRFSYIVIFLRCFLPLKKLLKEKKPDFLFAHLIVSLPMILFIFFKFNTKLCLRISGHIKFNIFRKFLWKISSKNIYKVFCPSEETKKRLIEQKIFDASKIVVLKDPILKTSEIRILKNEKIFINEFIKNNIILIGRLTKQKNFELFIKAFDKIHKKYPTLKVNIFGEGELRKNLQDQINFLKLEKKIFLHGFVENIFKYLKNSRIFVLTSLWEDPGAVLVEAAYCNTLVVASNCDYGPNEILLNGKAGFLFENNSLDSLILELEKSINCSGPLKREKLFLLKNNSKSYTYFRHSKIIENYLL